MDIITESYLEEFSNNYSIVEKDISKKYEHFANFIIVSNLFDINRFNFNDIHTGINAPGIDGIAIIVNNRLCTSPKEVKDSINYNNKLEVEFIFIQSKTSSKFEGTEIEGFFRWTKTFFKFEKSSTFTNEFNSLIEVAKTIYTNSKYFKRFKPLLKMFYVCNGKWVNDELLNKIIEDNTNEIDNTNLFESIEFNPCDAKKTQKMYMKTKLPIEASITLENSIQMPKIDGVKSAIYTILPFKEFIKIIEDENGKLKSIFDDNIRGFLGIKDNNVNQDIVKTLEDGRCSEFCILNNGVTIIVEEISGANMTITLTNYQIVNGCQTSNVLYECRGIDGIENVYVPVKIIETDNYKVQVKVTRATNNQTEVGVEQLEALTDFQKELEQYYLAMAKKDSDKALYYERRANQYRNSTLNPANIINIENQIKVYTAMFNEKPYIVSGYYGKLIKGLGNDVFNSFHKMIPYYTSALAYTKLIKLFNAKIVDNSLWRYRYHMIMIAKYYITRKRVPQQNGKDIDEYCNKIIDVLNNEQKCKDTFLGIQKFLLSMDNELALNQRKSSEKRVNTEIILKEVGYKFLGVPKQMKLI